MSDYTTRIIEVNISESKGYLNDIDVFPEGIQNGDIYTLPYNKIVDGNKYCKYVDGKWEFLKTCPRHWTLLKAYIPRGPRKKQQTVLVDEYDENLKPTGRKIEQVVGSPDKNAYLFKDDVGKDIWFKIEREWSNNGGNVRDNYISKMNNTPITGRGLPSDISEETNAWLEEDKAREYGYSFTWCTLQEWYDEYEKVQERILKKIQDLYTKKEFESSQKKLDFIIKNLGKVPSDKDVKNILKNNKRKSDDEDLFDFDFEMDCLIEEELPELWSIAYEIGRIEAFVDMYDELGNSDYVRIIYYLS